MFRTYLIHQPFASNATSCTRQQLLLHYQIPQYDRHHFPMIGILLILLFLHMLTFSGGSRGCHPHPPTGPNSFEKCLRRKSVPPPPNGTAPSPSGKSWIRSCVLVEKCPPPQRKILDPPLVKHVDKQIKVY